MIDINKEKELVKLAIKASEGSYSPYSHFKVGAAILCDDGEIFTGSNIENASYGAAICAERTAAAYAAHKKNRKFLAVAVYGSPKGATGDELQYAFPCGICRQFLNEFSVENMVLLVGKSVDDYIKTTLDDLLPNSFGPKDLDMEKHM